MKSAAVLIALLLPAGCLFGQRSEVPGNAAPPLLQRPYEAARDFFNLYAFANSTFDTNGSYLNSGSGGNAGSAPGFVVGGGASGYHQWSTGVLELSYRGDYRSYPSQSNTSGNDQNLTFIFRKDFSRRWSFMASVAAGILNNGGTYYSSSPNPTNPSQIVQTNPFTNDTRFAGTDLSITYQKSMRLSYQLTGSYFLTRYSAGLTSYGSNNITGSGAAHYRLSRKTTLSGTYSHSRFIYQHSGGGSNVDSVFATVSHSLAPHWEVSGAGGLTRTSSNGLITVPVLVQIGQQTIPIIEVGNYHQTALLPYYQGTLNHDLRHDSVSVSGGQSVSPGNGFLLASRTLGINGVWVHNLRRSNLSLAGYYAKLTSITSTIVRAQSNRGVSLSYAYNLIHHVGLDARYDYINYSSFGSYGGRADNRFTFGIYFTSKDIPLGLF